MLQGVPVSQELNSVSNGEQRASVDCSNNQGQSKWCDDLRFKAGVFQGEEREGD